MNKKQIYKFAAQPRKVQKKPVMTQTLYIS